MTFRVISDSSCDIKDGALSTEQVPFATVPLKIIVGEQEFIDDDNIDVPALLKAMEGCKTASSSACPSIEEWAEQFRMADCSFAICLTSALSGTYNSALQARELVLEETPEKKIVVIDSKSTAGAMILNAKKAYELISTGASFEEMATELQNYAKSVKLLFSLSNFDNLVKTGRMSKIAGLIAGTLGIRAIAKATDDGEIKVIDKPRGEKKALKRMVELMSTMKEVTGPVEINHVNNLAAATEIKRQILACYKNVGEVSINACKGLCAYYAQEKGILLSF